MDNTDYRKRKLALQYAYNLTPDSVIIGKSYTSFSKLTKLIYDFLSGETDGVIKLF